MDNDGEVLLQELLANEADEFEARINKNIASLGLPDGEAPSTAEKAKAPETHTQWALGGNGRFMPVGATAPTLPAGIYETFATPGMWGLEQTTISSDGIYLLPDMATKTVMDEAKKFWASEARYRKHNLLYKRGIILWGPPGGGKTVAIKLLMNELVRRDGIVILAQNIQLTILCLKAIRRIEPKRNLIVVLEDIDEIIQSNGESHILSMLDGENNVDNILHLATTNHPDRIGARIINRPSRFDRRIYVDMPNDDARRAYLDKATQSSVDSEQLDKWVADTQGLSIAHLRELVAAVHCLDQPYDEVLDRLKKMAIPVKSDDGFKRKGVGFRSPTGVVIGEDPDGGY